MIHKGDWIKKNNNKPFADTNKAIKVTKVWPIDGQPHLRINNKFAIDPAHVTIITEDEASQLNNEYRAMEISETRTNDMFAHIREATGEPKVAYENAASAIRALDDMRRRYPDSYFEAYKCPICGKLHIGKTTPEQRQEIDAARAEIINASVKTSSKKDKTSSLEMFLMLTWLPFTLMSEIAVANVHSSLDDWGIMLAVAAQLSLFVVATKKFNKSA